MFIVNYKYCKLYIVNYVLIDPLGIDLKFPFYSKIFLSLCEIHGKVDASVHVCTSDYLKCAKCEVHDHVCKHVVAGGQKNVYQDF